MKRTALGGALSACVFLAALMIAATSIDAKEAGQTGYEGVASVFPLPSIVYGTLTNDFVTTAALLVGNNPGTATLNCTGVMIGCETLLTAAQPASLPRTPTRARR